MANLLYSEDTPPSPVFPTTGALTGTALNTDTYNYSNGNWGDQLVSFNGQAIVYDQMGNPTTYLGATLSWENIRQLASYVKGNTNVSYTYNVDGIRTSKTVNGVTHIYALEGTRILLETYGTVLIVYLYDEVGSPIGLAYRDSATADTTLDKEEQFTYYLFTKNLQGDIIGIYNEQGQVVTLYRYDAWGNHTVQNWTSDNIGNINPFRYRGYYYDTDTGFYYLNSRYYDPQVKRFINADEYAATGQGFTGNNMFAYCGNNSVNRVDYTGQFWSEIWEFAKTAVAEIGKAMGVMSPAYVGCGGAAAVDGILPFGDVVAVAGAALLTVGTIGYGIYQAAQASTISIPKNEEKAEAIPAPPSTPTVIYRYGGTNPGNLTPKAKDMYSGLSFSTIPMPGAAMTTIEALNATGVVYAVQDGATHVSVRPVGATMEDWINAGSGSIWTQAVKSVVIKWYGGD